MNNIENKIQELVEKYKDKVQRETIGCGLGPYRDDVKNAGREIAEELFKSIVGERPTNGFDTPEYLEWYKKAYVFGELLSPMGTRYHDCTWAWTTPPSLRNSYGPRD